MSRPHAGLGAGWFPQGLRPHKGDCAFIPVLWAPPNPHPSALNQARPPAERSASTAHGARGTGAPAAEGPADRRAAFRAQMPTLPSLTP